MMVFAALHKLFGDYNRLKQNYNSTNNKYLKRLYRAIVSYYNHEKCCGLPLYIKNNGSLNFVHGYCGIFISGSAEIHNNVTIYQFVTIGSVRQIDSKSFGSPVIGENVILGAGCKIIGNVIIGKNCRIAPNAFVNMNLPDNTIFINETTIITREKKLINKVYQNSGSNWLYLESGKKILEKNIEAIELLNQKVNLS